MNKNTTAIISGIVLALLLLSASAATAQTAMVKAVKVKVNLLEYIAGGVGQGEREAIRKVQDNYDLKLVFANDDGNYLANVVVLITDSEGRELVHTVANGPWFLAELPQGEYTVSAVFEQEKQTATVSVDRDSLNVARFIWE